MRLSLSYTFVRLVGVPEVAEVAVVAARERMRMRYQMIAAMIAKAMMIHSQEEPPSVGAGAAGEGVAGGVA